jgi:hypothetical protein
MHKKFLNLVMGLVNKDKVQVVTNNNTPVSQQDQLSVQELEFLLMLVKQATFKGEYVEIVYNTTLKLQNQYLKQNK